MFELLQQQHSHYRFLCQEKIMIQKLGHDCYFGFVRAKQAGLLRMDAESILSSRQFWNFADYDGYRIWDNERELSFWKQLLHVARYRALLNKQVVTSDCAMT